MFQSWMRTRLGLDSQPNNFQGSYPGATLPAPSPFVPYQATPDPYYQKGAIGATPDPFYPKNPVQSSPIPDPYRQKYQPEPVPNPGQDHAATPANGGFNYKPGMYNPYRW